MCLFYFKDKFKQKMINLKEKIACITIDFEKDYGSRIGEFNILKSNKKEIYQLFELFSDFKVPVSGFIQTNLLLDYSDFFSVIKEILDDFHSHSHTHAVLSSNIIDEEIKLNVSVFKNFFNRQPLGYRAPLGILSEKNIDILKKNNFLFSSSIYPFFFPGRFNYIFSQKDPFFYPNQLMEIPLAVTNLLRYPISLSYMKLIGWRISHFLYSAFKLPNILVFNSHLHDYIVNQESFSNLPLKLRISWGRNKYKGPEYFKKFLRLLKRKGYKFMTMTELYYYLKEKGL